MINPKRDPRSVLLGSIIGNFLHIWSLYLIRVTKRWLSANNIEWNILLKKFINQRRTLISVLGSVTSKGKNLCTWSLIYMLFYHWFYLLNFASLDLRSMNLLYLRHCYLFMWFWAWVCYINTYVSAIDGMIMCMTYLFHCKRWID